MSTYPFNISSYQNMHIMTFKPDNLMLKFNSIEHYNTFQYPNLQIAKTIKTVARWTPKIQATD